MDGAQKYYMNRFDLQAFNLKCFQKTFLAFPSANV